MYTSAMGDLPEHPTVVGMVELARRLDVKRDTLNKWRARGLAGTPFPSPRWDVGGNPAWDWDEVTAWLRAVGRPVSAPT